MLFWYYRTETSVDDFVQFVENESSQALARKKNPKAAQKNPWVKFDKNMPGQVFSRTIVRQYLFEYLEARARTTNEDIIRNEYKENKHFFFGKGVKDFILMTGKEQFTFAEIAELIESHAVLNYVSDTF